MAQSMNQMVDQLGGLLKNLTEGVATLSSSATELEAISGQDHPRAPPRPVLGRPPWRRQRKR